MNDGVDLVPAGQKRLPIGADGLRDIAMNIAVAEVAEGSEPRAWDRCHRRTRGFFQKSRDIRDGNADVMLDRAAFMALGVRQKFAQLPEIFALIERGGDRRILDDMFLARRFEEREQSRGKPLPALRTQFEQHVPSVFAGQNLARAFKMREEKIQADARD